MTLTQPGAPNSLDPGTFNQAFEWFFDLAYEPLIYWDASGKAAPGLAQSWGYVGEGNRTFEIVLRPGAKFSDGTDVTAESVKASIEYTRTAGGGAATRWSDKTITVTGPLTLRIEAKNPDPMLDRELSQNFAGSHIISAAGLKDPKQLGTTTAGAGPYVLVPGDTVASDHYTYAPNPHYWNKAAIHYDKVVIKVIPNTNSVLNALKTGQVDVGPADYTVVDAAQSARLQVKQTPLLFLGLNLIDRNGSMLPALRDVRVRQALNFAVDRATITKALFGQWGVPTEQTVLPKDSGSFADTVYPYDPEKAKQLLAQAGYGGGLEIPVLTTSYNGQSQVTQAIAGDLEKVGVSLKLTNLGNYDQYRDQLTAKKFPVASVGFGCLPTYLEGPSLFLPNAATFNPFKTSDPELTALFGQAAAANETDRARLETQVQRRLVEQAWFVPVTLAPKFYFARSTVAGVEPSTGQPLPNPVWFTPAA
ncbi:ABC transporter substrate-binding protein [Amycolatopsis pithecellobii]|uniref:ABC transporter substrate-binding protein n=1 Tax=Amycolatopsis pithecellobii TaxID=664692 RepID=UPI00140E75CF|nr:ABC transporter substrate-binding protein [Amycolatopsis pithecellobii]